MNETSSPRILAIDSGTSSTRVLAFDFAGKAASPIAQRAYAQTTTPDGGVETDADALLELTAQCLDEVLENLAGTRDAAPVAAVSMSCFWHSLMGVGPDDAPRTPLFSWADNRAASQIKNLRAKLDENAAHARTGCVFHASYWPAKLLWLHQTRPELFDGQTRWMSFAEYLSLKLLGAARVSLSMASGTGLFHQNACDWDEEMLSVLPINRAALSPLCDAADALNAPLEYLSRAASTRAPQNDAAAQTAAHNVNAHNAIFATSPDTAIASTRDASGALNTQHSTLNDVYAARWPQLQNARWFPALGDGACSNLGSGCAQTRDGEKTRIALNVGTSGALRVVLREYSGAPPRGLFRYRIDATRSVVGGALSNGGNVLMWARKNLALPENAEARLAAMNPDAHGLTVLPFLAGERSPDWNDAARFVLDGATLDTAPEEIYRAALEGASLRFLCVLQLLQSALQSEKAPPQSLASTRDNLRGAQQESAAPNGDNTHQTEGFAQQTLSRAASQAEATTKAKHNLDSQSAASTRAAIFEANALQAKALQEESVPPQSEAPDAASTRDDENFEIVVSGGALSYSAAWARIMTDCLGAPLIESHEAQASARGAALMALESLGVIENVADVPSERGAVLSPDAAHHALYLQALQRQNALYQKLCGSFESA